MSTNQESGDLAATAYVDVALQLLSDEATVELDKVDSPLLVTIIIGHWPDLYIISIHSNSAT